VGTFLVDIADAETNEIIWRGWARLDVGAALSNSERMQESIDAAMSKMFRAFPVPIASIGHPDPGR
jgi:hypothetical protein